MRQISALLTILAILNACHEPEVAKTEFTGNEAIYALSQGSTYQVNGTITFKEKLDGSAVVKVELSGTEGDMKHPVHIHLGNISTPNADVSALLNPVIGKTGISETHLTMLADESLVSYRDLLNLDACVKVHLSDSGPDKNIVLAGGNIGLASTTEDSNGRSGMSVCKSE